MRTSAEWIGFLAGLSKRAALKPDVVLQPHQERARRKMETGSGSLAVFHGTGLGKGLTAISGVERLRQRGRAGRVLVVTPASLRANFAQDTIGKFTDSSVLTIGKAPKKPLPASDYYVASYARFRRNPQQLLAATGADTLVLDEVHRARNPKSKLYRALMSTRPQIRNVVGLTGSPVSNKPADLVPIMDIVHGQRGHGLGTQGGFTQRYVGTKKVRKHRFFGPSTLVPAVKQEKRLKRELAGKIDYVPHSAVADKLPRELTETIQVPMSPHQKKLYSFALNQVDPISRYRIERGLPMGKEQARHVFARLLQARQASNAVHTLDRRFTPAMAAEATPKVRQVLDDALTHLETTPDGQVVMYTNFIQGGADTLIAGLRARGVDPAIFIGKGRIKGHDRQQAVRDFRSGKRRVIVVSGAGAEGISLDNATMFQSLDGHFSPAILLQAQARARRMHGLAHRPPEERQVIIRHYQSILPRTWVDKALLRRRSKTQSTDEWVAQVARKKDEMNETLRAVMEEVG